MKLCKVENCNEKHRGLGFCNVHYLRYIRRGTTDLVRHVTFEERFKNSYKINKDNGCWEWTKSLGSHGYAHTANKGKNLRGHRVSYKLYIGKIPKGKLVLHKCDNRKCVNPEHLFLGTQKDNMLDMSKKNRHPIAQKGKKVKGFENGKLENHHSAKLNLIKVDEIRILLKANVSMAEIARRYSVSPKTIFNIKNNRIWNVIKRN